MIKLLVRLSVAACLLTFSVGERCSAQTRTMNTNSSGMLRSWPPVDQWQVALLHTTDGRFVCLTVTGQKSDLGVYLFGLEEAPQNLYVILFDQNQQAVTGDAIKVLIDNTLIGTYSADKRRSTAAMSDIRAIVPSADVGNFLNLLKVGGTLQLQTNQATYSASLDGMTSALFDVQNCLTEARALTADK